MQQHRDRAQHYAGNHRKYIINHTSRLICRNDPPKLATSINISCIKRLKLHQRWVTCKEVHVATQHTGVCLNQTKPFITTASVFLDFVLLFSLFFLLSSASQQSWIEILAQLHETYAWLTVSLSLFTIAIPTLLYISLTCFYYNVYTYIYYIN